MEAGREAGFYCEVCDCTLKDSLAWLDHLNGVYHNRALGLDVADIERSTVEQVKKRLERAKKRKKGEILAEEDGGDAPLLLMDGKAGDSSDDGSGSDDDDDGDGDGDGDGDDGSGSEGEGEDEDEGAGGSGEDDDEAAAMRKMMGFGSFGA
jgi:U4/U6.U5 tri-snRNP component SNU23